MLRIYLSVMFIGWLMKRDPTSKIWRRRYFVLRDERCWYYELTVG